MKSKAIISFVLAFLLVTILTPLGQTEASTSRVAIISEFKGTVEVKKSGGKKKLKAFKKMSLNQGDEVTTGDDSTVTLKFSNGTDEDDTLMLDKNTTVTFSKVSNKQGTVTKVTMKKGNAWVDVKSIKNKSDEFTLETPTAVMGVRGTHFMVSIDPSTGLPTLFVSSGKVAVNPSQSPSSPNSEAGSAPPITIFPGTQLTYFPADSELNPNDMINALDIDQLINSASPDIIAAILKNKESIDKENEELIASLFDGAGYTGLDFSEASQFENYKNNVQILLQHILRSVADSGKVSEQQLQQIVDEANRNISDANRQYDLQRTPPPLSTEAGIAQAEKERRMKELEEARNKKVQQQEELKQQQQNRQQELIAEIQKQKELIEQQNRKAAEDAKKRAEEQLKQQLNDAQRQALEERMRQREQEDRRPAPTPTPPAPTPTPRPTPPPPAPDDEWAREYIQPIEIGFAFQGSELPMYLDYDHAGEDFRQLVFSDFPRVTIGDHLVFRVAGNYIEELLLTSLTINGQSIQSQSTIFMYPINELTNSLDVAITLEPSIPNSSYAPVTYSFSIEQSTIPESWGEYELPASLYTRGDNGEMNINLVRSDTNSSLYRSSPILLKSEEWIEIIISPESLGNEVSLVNVLVNGEESMNQIDGNMLLIEPSLSNGDTSKDTIKISFERMTDEGVELGTYTLELNYFAEPESVFEIELVSGIENVIPLNYEQSFVQNDNYDLPMFELNLLIDEENEYGEDSYYRLTTQSSNFEIIYVKSIEYTQGETSEFVIYPLEENENIYHLAIEEYPREYVIKVKDLSTDQLYQFSLSSYRGL